jgi:Protein of unknown function (DUF2470)
MSASLDLPQLALQARTALADARSVTLLIEGVGRVPANSASVLLHDNDGLPTFLCDPGSPVTPAARRGCAAMLSVPVRDHRQQLTVLVCGRLARLGAEEVDGVQVDVVGLEPDQVVVECDDPSRPNVLQYCVPLELYRRATPDPLVGCAARIIQHTNESHQDDLRRCVALRMGVCVDEIAGVTLAALDADGARLQWVDGAGSHTLRLGFPLRATTPPQLAGLLRMQLGQ